MDNKPDIPQPERQPSHCPLPAEVSEVELVYRSKVAPSKRPKIMHSNDAYNIFRAGWNEDHIDFRESFKAMYLNSANRLLGMFDVSSGGLTGTIADPRLIITMALKLCATRIILCHNHPSGNLRPSNTDTLLTTKIKCAATFLDITIADHLIISSEGYFSFADEGML